MDESSTSGFVKAGPADVQGSVFSPPDPVSDAMPPPPSTGGGGGGGAATGGGGVAATGAVAPPVFTLPTKQTYIPLEAPPARAAGYGRGTATRGGGGGGSGSAARGGRRGKVALAPEYSPMAWSKLHTEATDLSGVAQKDAAIKGGVTLEELHKHNTQDDCWMAINGIVYNVTPYIKFHPGGIEEIMRGAGSDATQIFNEIHQWVTPRIMLQKCMVGPLAPRKLRLRRPKAASSSSSALRPFLDRDSWRTVRLAARQPLAADAVLLRFTLPGGADDVAAQISGKVDTAPRKVILGIQYAGQHLEVLVPKAAARGGAETSRAYTPVSWRGQIGSFELGVRVYDDGAASSMLGALKPGDSISIRGPMGNFKYRRGTMMIGKKAVTVKSLLLLAAGSGITPMLQIINEVVRDKTDDTKVDLVYVNRSAEHIMFQAAIEEACRRFSTQVRCKFIVSAASSAASSSSTTTTVAADATTATGAGGGAGAGGSVEESGTSSASVTVGRLDAKLWSKVVPAATYNQGVCVCGPPGFNTAMDGLLRAAYYNMESVHIFT